MADISLQYFYLVFLFLLCPCLLFAQPEAWTLDACITHALHENVALNQSAINNEINAINYQQAKAGIFPNLNVSDAHTLNNGRYLNAVTDQYTTENASSNSFNITGTVTLYNGSKTLNLIKENKLNCTAGNLDLEKAENDLMLNVTAAYMQVLYEYEAVDIAAAIIDADTEHVNYTKKYVDAGSLPLSNLLQIQAQLQTDIASKVNSENQLLLARVTLMQLMELPLNDSFEIERPQLKEIESCPISSSQQLYNTAASFLPEVQSALIKTQSSEMALKVSRSEIIPKLTLSGNITTAYSSTNQLLSYSGTSQMETIGYLQNNPSEPVIGPVTTTATNSAYYPVAKQFNDNLGKSISLNLVIPIFNNLAYKSDIKRAEASVRIARLNETAVKNQLRKNVEQAYADLQVASKNYIATKEQLLSETRSYHDMEIKFRAGTINATDFFVEKSNYNKALFSHLSAKYDYLFKNKVVNFYTGIPLTTENE